MKKKAADNGISIHDISREAFSFQERKVHMKIMKYPLVIPFRLEEDVHACMKRSLGIGFRA